MMNIIFIAPPAAGKGTQSKKITEKYHLPHISTGDLLRGAVQKGDRRGKDIQAIMESGQLVSDEITCELLTERIQMPDCVNGYILDGFPRSLKQAYKYEEILKNLNQPLGNVIYLSVDEEIAKKRILGRISCPKCGAVYNDMIEELKPEKSGICNHCHESLEKRGDDNEETFTKRFETYIKNTEPLLAHYKELGVVHEIDSTKPSEEVFAEIETIIRSQV